MTSEYSVLLVDSDEAFATMLQQSLEQSGEYRATVTTNGNEALQALDRGSFNLAIVDPSLTDPDGTAVARKLRQRQAELRLLLIPFMGEQIPSELADLDTQGVLPRPFFLPELPGRIADAIAQPIGGRPAAAPAPEPSTSTPPTPVRASIPQARMEEATRTMKTLSQELNADVVILTCRGELIARTGRLSADEAQGLAQAVGESWQTSARVAQILGQEQLRFEQSVEGGAHMLYSLAVAEDIILSVALRANIPLGLIRHHTKATAEAVRPLVTAAH
jgi:CheY-like chemotaxis protein